MDLLQIEQKSSQMERRFKSEVLEKTQTEQDLKQKTLLLEQELDSKILLLEKTKKEFAITEQSLLADRQQLLDRNAQLQESRQQEQQQTREIINSLSLQIKDLQKQVLESKRWQDMSYSLQSQILWFKTQSSQFQCQLQMEQVMKESLETRHADATQHLHQLEHKLQEISHSKQQLVEKMNLCRKQFEFELQEKEDEICRLKQRKNQERPVERVVVETVVLDTKEYTKAIQENHSLIQRLSELEIKIQSLLWLEKESERLGKDKQALKSLLLNKEQELLNQRLANDSCLIQLQELQLSLDEKRQLCDRLARDLEESNRLLNSGLKEQQDRQQEHEAMHDRERALLSVEIERLQHKLMESVDRFQLEQQTRDHEHFKQQQQWLSKNKDLDMRLLKSIEQISEMELQLLGFQKQEKELHQLKTRKKKLLETVEEHASRIADLEGQLLLSKNLDLELNELVSQEREKSEQLSLEILKAQERLLEAEKKRERDMDQITFANNQLKQDKMCLEDKIKQLEMDHLSLVEQCKSKEQHLSLELNVKIKQLSQQLESVSGELEVRERDFLEQRQILESDLKRKDQKLLGFVKMEEQLVKLQEQLQLSRDSLRKQLDVVEKQDQKLVSQEQSLKRQELYIQELELRQKELENSHLIELETEKQEVQTMQQQLRYQQQLMDSKTAELEHQLLSLEHDLKSVMQEKQQLQVQFARERQQLLEDQHLGKDEFKTQLQSNQELIQHLLETQKDQTRQLDHLHRQIKSKDLQILELEKLQQRLSETQVKFSASENREKMLKQQTKQALEKLETLSHLWHQKETQMYQSIQLNKQLLQDRSMELEQLKLDHTTTLEQLHLLKSQKSNVHTDATRETDKHTRDLATQTPKDDSVQREKQQLLDQITQLQMQVDRSKIELEQTKLELEHLQSMKPGPQPTVNLTLEENQVLQLELERMRVRGLIIATCE
ncbi:hypothetical protein EDD86DRAFT_94956 [Gorgonomyces haynaldii]|nr:hypothetical protein EDD86DRAFT_94956 [Gorgonomyces haynaldii]